MDKELIFPFYLSLPEYISHPVKFELVIGRNLS
jgi:hypothetical protein